MNSKNLILISLFLGLTFTLLAQNKDIFIESNKGCKIFCTNYTNECTVSWDGKCLNGFASGYGTRIIYKNGNPYSSFIGNMLNGKRSGQGTYTWSNGEKYVGNWQNDKRSGQGTNIWSNGEKYVGNWQNGFGVKGKKYYPSGKINCVCTWDDKGQYIQDGTWYYEDGSVYATYQNGIETLSRIAKLEAQLKEQESRTEEVANQASKTKENHCIVKEEKIDISPYDEASSVGECLKRYPLKIVKGNSLSNTYVIGFKCGVKKNSLIDSWIETESIYMVEGAKFDKYQEAFKYLLDKIGCKTYNMKNE
jgi:hypothetical protein